MPKSSNDPAQPPREVVICTSPKAGSGRGREQLPRLVDLLEAASLSVFVTTSIRELQARVAGAEAGHTCVVAAGGDGTLALVADHVSSDVPLIPMPMGTENLLARYFKCSADADHVLATILTGRYFRLDAGRANGRLFLIMATCGFDAEVVRALHLTRRGHISRLSYARPIYRAMRRYRFPDIEIRIDDQPDPIACRWGMVFNLPCYGGALGIEPAAVGDDAQLDVIAFQKGSVPSGFRYVAGIATGRHLRFRDVVRRRGSLIEMTSRLRVPYQLDGDYVGRLPLRIETLPGHVLLRVPQHQSRD